MFFPFHYQTLMSPSPRNQSVPETFVLDSTSSEDDLENQAQNNLPLSRERRIVIDAAEINSMVCSYSFLISALIINLVFNTSPKTRDKLTFFFLFSLILRLSYDAYQCKQLAQSHSEEPLISPIINNRSRLEPTGLLQSGEASNSPVEEEKTDDETTHLRLM